MEKSQFFGQRNIAKEMAMQIIQFLEQDFACMNHCTKLELVNTPNMVLVVDDHILYIIIFIFKHTAWTTQNTLKFNSAMRHLKVMVRSRPFIIAVQISLWWVFVTGVRHTLCGISLWCGFIAKGGLPCPAFSNPVPFRTFCQLLKM